MMTLYKLAKNNRGYRLRTFADQLIVEHGFYDGKTFWVYDNTIYLNELQKLVALSMNYKQLNNFINQLKQ